VWAGRDETAGGTWLGVNAHGLLAAITNRRNGPDAANDPALPSRGGLCLGVLRQPSPTAAQSFAAEALAAHRYNPFNLLCASPSDGWVTTWRGDSYVLMPGPHVVTNRGDVDDESQICVQRALGFVAQLDVPSLALGDLFTRLGLLCADTSEPEPICRPDGPRGTVSSSLVALHPDGSLAAYWHANGPPSEVKYAPVVTALDSAVP
jgi:hypothetical protein